MTEHAGSLALGRLMGMVEAGGHLTLTTQIPAHEADDDFCGFHCVTELRLAHLVRELRDSGVVRHAIWRNDEGNAIFLQIRK